MQMKMADCMPWSPMEAQSIDDRVGTKNTGYLRWLLVCEVFPFRSESSPSLRSSAIGVDTEWQILVLQGVAIIDVLFRYYEEVVSCTRSDVLDDIQTIVLLR